MKFTALIFILACVLVTVSCQDHLGGIPPEPNPQPSFQGPTSVKEGETHEYQFFLDGADFSGCSFSIDPTAEISMVGQADLSNFPNYVTIEVQFAELNLQSGDTWPTSVQIRTENCTNSSWDFVWSPIEVTIRPN